MKYFVEKNDYIRSKWLLCKLRIFILKTSKGKLQLFIHVCVCVLVCVCDFYEIFVLFTRMLHIEAERFVNVPDEFICSICTNVLNYPNVLEVMHMWHNRIIFSMIQSNWVLSFEDEKGHCFCKDCIEDWLKINKTCPLDRAHLDESELKPIRATVKSLFAK